VQAQEGRSQGTQGPLVSLLDVSDRSFGRFASYDERSLAYPVRRLLSLTEAPRSYSWRHIQLDQGDSSACTGFSATMEAAARPKPVFGDPCKITLTPEEIHAIDVVALRVYQRAQVLDEWPGEAYEGSSVLASLKAGQERGWWAQYRWALGPGPEAAANDVIRSVGRLGPVLMGTWWYSDMMRADVNGYLNISGAAEGGHAYLLTRYSVKRDAVWTPNSWGGHGQGWIKRADLVELLARDGEAAVVLNRALPL